MSIFGSGGLPISGGSGSTTSLYPTLNQVTTSTGTSDGSSENAGVGSAYSEYSIYMTNAAKIFYYSGGGWVSLEPPGTGGAENMSQLQDVDLSNYTATDRNVLVYDAQDGFWKPSRSPGILAVTLVDGVLKLSSGTTVLERNITLGADKFISCGRYYIDPAGLLQTGLATTADELMFAYLKTTLDETVIFSELSNNWVKIPGDITAISVGTDLTAQIDASSPGTYTKAEFYPTNYTYVESQVVDPDEHSVRLGLRYLSDVDFVTEPATDNEVLAFDSASQKFIPRLFGISDLKDVDAVGVVDGDILKYDVTTGEFKADTLYFDTPSLKIVEADPETGKLTFRVGKSLVAESFTLSGNTYVKKNTDEYYHISASGEYTSDPVPGTGGVRYPVWQDDAGGTHIIYVDDPTTPYWALVPAYHESIAKNVPYLGAKTNLGFFVSGFDRPVDATIVHTGETIVDEETSVLTKVHLRLNNLEDVEISGEPTDGQILVFDGTLGKFKASSAAVPEWSLLKIDWESDNSLKFRVGTDFTPEKITYSSMEFHPIDKESYYYDGTQVVQGIPPTLGGETLWWRDGGVAEHILFDDTQNAWIYLTDAGGPVAGAAYTLPAYTLVGPGVSGVNRPSGTSVVHSVETITNERSDVYTTVQFELNRMSDVDTKSSVVTDKQVLMYDAASSLFKPTDIDFPVNTSVKRLDVNDGVVKITTGSSLTPRYFTGPDTRQYEESSVHSRAYVENAGGIYTLREGNAPSMNASAPVWRSTTPHGWVLVDDGSQVEWGQFLIHLDTVAVNAVIATPPTTTAPWDGDLITPSPSSQFVLTQDVVGDEEIFESSISLEKMADVDMGDSLMDGRILVWDGASHKFVPHYGISPTSAPLNKQILEFNTSTQTFVPFTAELDTLSDVQGAAASTAGQILMFDATTGSYKPHTMILDDMADVDSASATEGQHLEFSTATSTFVPVDLELNKNTDVSFDPLGIVDGEYLIWDSGNSYFTNSKLMLDQVGGVDLTVAAILGDILLHDGTNFVPTQHTLDTLLDVDTSSLAPAAGDILKFNGTQWVPGDLALDELQDVQGASAATTGDFLRFDGTVFTPDTASLDDLTNVANTSTSSEGQYLVYRSGVFVPETVTIENTYLRSATLDSSGLLTLTTGDDTSTPRKISRGTETWEVAEGFWYIDGTGDLHNGLAPTNNKRFYAWKPTGTTTTSLVVVDSDPPTWYEITGDVTLVSPTAVPGVPGGTFSHSLDRPTNTADATVVGNRVDYYLDVSLQNLRGVDVTTASPADLQILKFDAASGNFIPADLGLDLTGATTGQILIYDGTNYVPEDLNLSKNTDVDLTGLALGNHLEFDGTTFVPADLLLSKMQDVNLGGVTLTDKHFLVYDGTSTWIPTLIDSSLLDDFDLTGIAAGNVLVWDASTGKMVAREPDLNMLSDVNISGTIQGGMHLEYDAGTGTFVPKLIQMSTISDVDLSTPAAAGQVLMYASDSTYKPVSLLTSHLADIDYSTAIADNQFLQWNSTKAKYEPVTLELTMLSDVSVPTTPLDGQYLEYDSATNTFTPETLTLSKLQDVDLTGMEEGNLLAWDGTKFVRREINLGPDTFLQDVQVDTQGNIVHYVGTGVSERLVESEYVDFVVRVASGQIEIGGVAAGDFTFKKGSVYTFNMEDVTLDATNTILFSTTSESIGITPYTDGVEVVGVPGEFDARVILTTSDSTPDTLYYYNSDYANFPPPTGGTITVLDQESYTKTTGLYYFDLTTGNVYEGTSPTSGISYPAWVNSDRSTSFIIYDDATLPRWIEYGGDADLLTSGQNINGQFQFRYYWKKYAQYPVTESATYALTHELLGIENVTNMISTTLALNNLQDVDIESSPPEDGHVLAWDADLSTWVAMSATAAAGATTDTFTQAVRADKNGNITIKTGGEVEEARKIVRTSLDYYETTDVYYVREEGTGVFTYTLVKGSSAPLMSEHLRAWVSSDETSSLILIDSLETLGWLLYKGDIRTVDTGTILLPTDYTVLNNRYQDGLFYPTDGIFTDDDITNAGAVGVVISLDNIRNVSFQEAKPVEGNTLVFDAEDSTFRAGKYDIKQLENLDVTSAGDGTSEVIKYNATDENFELGNINISEITGINLEKKTPEEGDVLTYDFAAGVWNRSSADFADHRVLSFRVTNGEIVAKTGTAIIPDNFEWNGETLYRTFLPYYVTNSYNLIQGDAVEGGMPMWVNSYSSGGLPATAGFVIHPGNSYKWMYFTIAGIDNVAVWLSTTTVDPATFFGLTPTWPITENINYNYPFHASITLTAEVIENEIPYRIPLKLNTLSDVTITEDPTVNQMLRWDDTENAFVPREYTAVTLDDVQATTLADGDVLMWDEDTGTFTNHQMGRIHRNIVKLDLDDLGALKVSLGSLELPVGFTYDDGYYNLFDAMLGDEYLYVYLGTDYVLHVGAGENSRVGKFPWTDVSVDNRGSWVFMDSPTTPRWMKTHMDIATVLTLALQSQTTLVTDWTSPITWNEDFPQYPYDTSLIVYDETKVFDEYSSQVTIDLNSLRDVDLATVAPEDGQIITYNADTSMWVPQDNIRFLTQLEDVQVPEDVANGDFLMYDSGNWTTAALPDYHQISMTMQDTGILESVVGQEVMTLKTLVDASVPDEFEGTMIQYYIDSSGNIQSGGPFYTWISPTTNTTYIYDSNEATWFRGDVVDMTLGSRAHPAPSANILRTLPSKSGTYIYAVDGSSTDNYFKYATTTRMVQFNLGEKPKLISGSSNAWTREDQGSTLLLNTSTREASIVVDSGDWQWDGTYVVSGYYTIRDAAGLFGNGSIVYDEFRSSTTYPLWKHTTTTNRHIIYNTDESYWVLMNIPPELIANGYEPFDSNTNESFTSNSTTSSEGLRYPSVATYYESATPGWYEFASDYSTTSLNTFLSASYSRISTGTDTPDPVAPTGTYEWLDASTVDPTLKYPLAPDTLEPTYNPLTILKTNTTTIRVAQLIDVDVTTVPPIKNSVMVWSEEEEKFVTSSGTLPVIDVTSTPPTGGEILQYDAGSETWLPTLDTLANNADIDFVSPLVDGQVLAFNATTGMWTPTDNPDRRLTDLTVDTLGVLTATVSSGVAEGFQLTMTGQTVDITPSIALNGSITLGGSTLYHGDSTLYRFLVDPAKFAVSDIGPDGAEMDNVLTTAGSYTILVTNDTNRTLYYYNPTVTGAGGTLTLRDESHLLFTQGTNIVYMEELVSLGSTWNVTLRGGSPPINGGGLEYPTWSNKDNSLNIIFVDEDVTLPSRQNNIVGKYWGVFEGSIPDINTTTVVDSTSIVMAAVQSRLSAGTGGQLYPVGTGITTGLSGLVNASEFQVTLGINNLADVDTMTQVPEDKQVLSWDEAGGMWVPSTDSLMNNSDVFYTVEGDDKIHEGAVLVWDDTDKKFKKSDGTFLPVDLTTNPPVEGNILMFDETNKVWYPTMDSLQNNDDIDLTGIVGGDGLVWDSDESKFVPTSLPKIRVDDATLAEGNILMWDATAEEWVNKQDDLLNNSDVAYDPTTITAGKALVWDEDVSKFVPGEGILPRINVDETTLAEGDILTWDAAAEEWVNKQDDLLNNSDVAYDPTTITAGKVLVWDEDVSKFVPGEGTLPRIDVTTVPPSDGQHLAYDEASETWIPTTDTLLNNSDVDYDPATITAGKVLVWDEDLSQFVPGEGTLPKIDVTTVPPTDGQHLAYDETTETWLPTTDTLTNNSDVDIETVPPIQNSVMTWDASQNKFTTSLGTLPNIDVLTTPPEDRNGLIYDGANDKWVPTPHTLPDFDADTTSPSDKDIFVYDSGSSTWVPVVHEHALNDLTDVDTTGYADHHHIVYDAEKGMWVSELSEDYRLVRLDLGTDGRLDATVSVPLERWILEYHGMTFEKQDTRFYVGNWDLTRLSLEGVYEFMVLDNPSTEIEGYTNYAVWKNISTTVTDANTIVFFDGSVAVAGSPAYSARWLISKYTYEELLAKVNSTTSGYQESETQDTSMGYDAGVDYPVNETLFLLNFDGLVDYDVSKQTIVSTTINLNNLGDVTNVLPQANHVIEYNADTEQYENKTTLMGKQISVDQGLLTIKNARGVQPELMEFTRPTTNLFFKRSASPVRVGFDGSTASGGTARGFVYTGGLYHALILVDDTGRRISGVDARTIMYNDQLGVWHVYDTTVEGGDLNVDDTRSLDTHRGVAKTWTNDTETLLWMNVLGFTMDPDTETGLPALIPGVGVDDVYTIIPEVLTEDYENIATTISIQDLADVDISGMVLQDVIYELLPMYSHLEDLDVADVTSTEFSRVYYNATLDVTIMKQKLFSGAITSTTTPNSIFWISVPGKYGVDFTSGDLISAFDISNLGVGQEGEIMPQGALQMPQAGYILKWDATRQKFVATSHNSIMTSFSQGPTQGQIMTYNQVDDTWTNVDNTLLNHDDVAGDDTDLLVDGAVLAWDQGAGQFVPVQGLQNQITLDAPEEGQVLEFNQTTGVFENKLPVNSQRITAQEGILTVTRARAFVPAMFQTLVSATPRYFRKSAVPLYGVSNGRDSGGFKNKIVVGASKQVGREYHAWIECDSTGRAITTLQDPLQDPWPLVIFYSESQGGWVYTLGHTDNFDNAAEFITNTVFLYGVDGVTDVQFEEISTGYFNFTLLQDLGFQSLNDPGTGMPAMAYNSTLGRNYTESEVFLETPESYEDIQDYISTKIELSNLYDVDTRVVILQGMRFIQEPLLGLYVDELNTIKYDNYPPNAVIYYNSDRNYTLIKHRLVSSAAPWVTGDTLDWLILEGRFGDPFFYGSLVTASIVQTLTVTDYVGAHPEGAQDSPSTHAALVWDGEKFRPSALATVTADLQNATTGWVPTWNDEEKKYELLDPLPVPVEDNIMVARGGEWITVSHDLNTLNDVQADLPTQGQVLSWSAADGMWVPVNLEEVQVPQLGQLADVVTDAPGEGFIIVYDSASQTWVSQDISQVVNKALPQGAEGDILVYSGGEWVTGSNVHALGELTNVEITSTPPLDQEILMYDASTAMWKSRSIPDISLGQLSNVDVNTDAPNVSDVLTWDGTNWTPTHHLHALGELTNVDLSIPAVNGQTLVYESSTATWKAATQAQGMALDTSVNVSTGYVVEWNSANSNWKPVPHEHTLDSLVDVDLTSSPPLDGEVLSYEAATGRWKTAAHAYNLNDLVDVSVDNANHMEFLRFDENSPGWVPSAVVMNDLGDVDVATSPPLEGQSLIYNTVNNKWVPGIPESDLPAGSETGQILIWNQNTTAWEVSTHVDQTTTFLANLLDTDASTPQEGELLVYSADTAKWTSRDIVVGDLADVDITSTAPVEGDVLAWDLVNRVWVPRQHILELQDLSNTSVSQAVAADFLRFDGTLWVPGGASLGEMEDVTVSQPVDGEVLTYDTTLNQWVAREVPVPLNIDVTPAQDQEILVFSSDSGKWVPGTHEHALSELVDVDMTTDPLNGEVLGFSASLGKWIPRTNELQDLSNVSDSQAAATDFLRFDGTLWVPGGASLGEMEDVAVPQPVDGEVLTYDTTLNQWVAREVPVPLNIDVTPAQDQDILVFSADSGKWVAHTHEHALSELTDVNIAVPQGGQVLMYDTLSNRWEAGDVGGVTTLSDLEDVNPTTPLDGQILMWDASTATWINSMISLGDLNGVDLNSDTAEVDDVLVWDGLNWVPRIHEHTLESLSNVDLTVPALDKEVLEYDAATGTWKASMHEYELGELTNVNMNVVGGVQDKDFLVYDSSGGEWVPSSASLDVLEDVDVTSTVPLEGQTLVYDTNVNKWVPGTIASPGATIPQGSSDGQHLEWNEGIQMWIPVDHQDGGSQVASLMDLTDVQGTPAVGDIITYDGTQWNTGQLMIGNAGDVDVTTTPPVDGNALVWEGDRWVTSPGILPTFQDSPAFSGQILSFSGDSNSWVPTWIQVGGDVVDYKLSSLTMSLEGVLTSTITANISRDSVYITLPAIQEFDLEIQPGGVLAFSGDPPSHVYGGAGNQLKFNRGGDWTGFTLATQDVTHTVDAQGDLLIQVDANTPETIILYLQEDPTQYLSVNFRSGDELIFVPSTAFLSVDQGGILSSGGIYKAYVCINHLISVVWWDTEWIVAEGDVTTANPGDVIYPHSPTLSGLLNHTGLLYPTGDNVEYKDYTYSDSNSLSVEIGLNQLKDVVVGAPAENDIIRCGAGGIFTNVPDNLSSKNDVDVAGLEVGSSLRWNGTAWVVSNLPTFEGDPLDGQIFKYDSQSQTFVPHTPVLSDMDNVDLEGAVDGSVLQFNANTGTWYAGPKPTDFVTSSITIDDEGNITTVVEDRNEATLNFDF